MKPTASITIIVAAILSIGCFSPHASAQDKPKPGELRFASATDVWSVVGSWHYACRDWRDMIDIRADGTFSRTKDGESGKWSLGGAQDHFVIILSWKNFPQDTVEMVTPVEFRGDSRKGEIIFRRLPVVAATAPR